MGVLFGVIVHHVNYVNSWLRKSLAYNLGIYIYFSYTIYRCKILFISNKTIKEGNLVCICYATIGIPTYGICLINLSGALGSLFKFVYTQLNSFNPMQKYMKYFRKIRRERIMRKKLKKKLKQLKEYSELETKSNDSSNNDNKKNKNNGYKKQKALKLKSLKK